MFLRIHNSYRKVVAICDEGLIGKKFEDGKRQIDLTTNFFKGEKKTEKEILEAINLYSAEDATFNIVGKESVSIALKAGIIKPEGIVEVKNVPTALALL